MSNLTAARMSYAAALVASVTYGLYVAIAIYTTYKVVVSSSRSNISRKIILAWIAVTFMVQTIYYIAGSKWSAIEFVDSTEDPGLFAGQLSSRLAVLKDTAYTVVIWLADGFILYRAFAIYAGSLRVVVLPSLLYMGSLVTGIGLLIETAKPGAAFGQTPVLNFGTPFWSLSVAMNVLTTLLIAGRLIYHRRLLRGSVGGSIHDFFAPEAVIFLESAALYAICSIIYIPMFAKDIPLQFPFSALLGSAASIAPHFIILRMISGKSRSLEISLISLRSRHTQTGESQLPVDTDHGEHLSTTKTHETYGEA